MHWQITISSGMTVSKSMFSETYNRWFSTWPDIMLNVMFAKSDLRSPNSWTLIVSFYSVTCTPIIFKVPHFLLSCACLRCSYTFITTAGASYVHCFYLLHMGSSSSVQSVKLLRGATFTTSVSHPFLRLVQPFLHVNYSYYLATL